MYMYNIHIYLCNLIIQVVYDGFTPIRKLSWPEDFADDLPGPAMFLYVEKAYKNQDQPTNMRWDREMCQYVSWLQILRCFFCRCSILHHDRAKWTEGERWWWVRGGILSIACCANVLSCLPQILCLLSS